MTQQWKGASEFMFWSCFTYDPKGPCHICKSETKEATEFINKWNAEYKAKHKAEWELNTAMARMGRRNKGGRKPVWKHTAKNGAMTRTRRKEGIDQ
jgi:hypothetical protein